MRSWAVAVVCLALGCSPAAGRAGDGSGAGGEGATAGTSSGLCTATDGCTQCAGCMDRCVCLLGEPETCAYACGHGGEGGGGGEGGTYDPPPPPGGSGGTSGSGGWSGGGTGGASGGAGGDSGSGGGPPPGGGGSGGSVSGCTYPPGPYGKSVGQVLDPALVWQGYAEGATQPGPIAIADYLDCDGSRNINAVLLTQAAVWCGACKEEAAEFNGLMAGGWTQKGIRVLTLMIETASGNPATVQTAKQWMDYFQAEGWAVAADPDFTFASSGSNGLPLSVVLDPRTMKIIDRSEGFDPTYGVLNQLAAQNKK